MLKPGKVSRLEFGFESIVPSTLKQRFINIALLRESTVP